MATSKAAQSARIVLVLTHVPFVFLRSKPVRSQVQEQEKTLTEGLSEGLDHSRRAEESFPLTSFITGDVGTNTYYVSYFQEKQNKDQIDRISQVKSSQVKFIYKAHLKQPRLTKVLYNRIKK